VVIAAVVVAAGYSWFAAGTKPFTVAADTVTAIAFAAMAAVMARSLRSGERAESSGAPAPSGHASEAASRSRLFPWAAAVAALIAWELVTYFVNNRQGFPTLSSLYDLAARWQSVKAVVFFCWLSLGGALFAR
jgi:hypothetical protein